MKMKKAIALMLVLLLFTGCVSSEEKNLVRNTVRSYFDALVLKKYDNANAMTVQGDENISNIIQESSVNNLIFKEISYEIWDIYKKDETLCAEVVITQLSLQAAFIDTVYEYDEYRKDASEHNKSLTEEALEDKWNEIFYNHVAGTTEKVSLRCEIILTPENKILMTPQLRNALFGGELNAINMLNSLNEGEE